MKRPDIDAIEARAAAATPGPWADCDALSRDGFTNVWAIQHGYENEIRVEDAAFISAAREDVPELIAYIRHLEENFILVPHDARTPNPLKDDEEED